MTNFKSTDVFKKYNNEFSAMQEEEKQFASVQNELVGLKS